MTNRIAPIRRLGILATLALVGATLVAPTAARADHDVWFDGGRVSAFSVGTSVRELMGTVAAECGLTVRFVADEGAEQVDVEIYGLPLSEALAAILSHRNYTVVGSQVWISSATRSAVAVASEGVLGEPSEQAGELVGTALAAADLASRQSAVLALGTSATSNAAALARVLETSGDEQIRMQALRGLDGIAPIDVDVLADLATDDSSQVRSQAIRLLSRRGDEKAQSVLEQLSSSADGLTRVAAMQALLRIAS